MSWSEHQKEMVALDANHSKYAESELSPTSKLDQGATLEDGEKQSFSPDDGTHDGMHVIPTGLKEELDINDRAVAQKMMRTATWINTFFLLTCDVLGPSQAPYAFAALGYVPGALLYFGLGIFAAYAGFILQRLFIVYDSDERPLRTFGDLGERIMEPYGRRWGKFARWYIAFFQFAQLWLVNATLILGNAQAVYQIANDSVCFISMSAVFAAAGFIFGCIKQLRIISHAANISIWVNLTICIATMAVASYTPALTNWGTDGSGAAPSSIFQSGYIAYDPATGEGVLPAHGTATTSFPFAVPISGVNTMITAYGGSTIFIEFMSEMKAPKDFWKAWTLSITLIVTAYLIYGAVMYSFQGSYVGNPANQGISPYGWQTALNALNICTVLIAAVMYGNVAMKVIYISVFQEIFNAPTLVTRKGTMLWVLWSLVFWWMGFIVVEAAPQVSALGGIIGALCFTQFAYTIPCLMQLLYELQQDRPGERFTRKIWLKAMDGFLALVSFAFIGLGMYGGVTVLISALAVGGTQLYGCNGP